MEDNVLAMLDISTAARCVSPARSHSMPPMEDPSSQRDSAVFSMWNAAKNRFTPTKEPLTVARQVIREKTRRPGR